MNYSTPGLPVHHQLLESTHTHIHWVGDAIQPSHPLSSSSLPALNFSQHRGLFQWVSSLHLRFHLFAHLTTLRYTISVPSLLESSVQFSCSVVSDSLRPHALQHTRLPCPSPTPRVYSNSCPLSWWRHPTSSSSVVPFSSCLQSLPASGSFQMSQFFTPGGQSIGVSSSASAPPMSIQDWFPPG